MLTQGGGAAEGDMDMATIKKFVSYCRQRCAPRLGPEAGQTLASEVGGWVGVSGVGLSL